MRILVYGGSFDPPHTGHLRAARAAQAIMPDQFLLIPAAVPPHKSPAADGAPPEDRLFMTSLMAARLKNASASEIELQREGPSYTSDTLRQLKAEWPDAEIVFLMGTDMLLSLPTWHEAKFILSLASVAVYSRNPGRRAELEAAAAALRRKYRTKVYVVAGEPVAISSTSLRSMLKNRRGRAFLAPEIYAYIIKKRLYGARPELSWLRERAYAYLKQERVAHVRGVETEALRLAVRWGADSEDAAEAAICHDITKKLTLGEQLRLCDKYGIMADELERSSQKLLHAKTGAVFAGELFGLSEPARDAIAWHTTGRPDMTALEKVIYLADYIEPGREGFSGLTELRQAAYEDLDAAMELALRMSLDEVRQRGETPHENTALAQAFYLDRLRQRGLAPVHAQDVPDAL